MTTTRRLNTAQQLLPNECLLHVLGFLRHDLFELYTLLTVNRFCYHVVLPWMLDNALERWKMNWCDCEWAVDREKLIVLYLVSALQYSGPAAESLLELCDLELVNPPSPKYQLLTEYMAGRSRLTVDYSKFQTQFALVYNDWNYVDLNSFVRLKTLPQEWEGTIPPPPMVLGRVDWDYKEQLRTALMLLFTTHNPESVTVLTLHFSSIHMFIPLANRFTNLRKLRLPRDESLPDSQIQDLITFLQSHQTAFPRKCRLDLDFHGLPHVSDDMPLQERRSQEFARARPMLLSYTVQEQPSTLDVSYIPRFYDHCDEIGTMDLRHFIDNDAKRYLLEGYAGQERFLERCYVLESLDLNLHNAHMFAWAVGRTTQGSQRPLPNLRKLCIRLTGTVRQMVAAVEDAAFVWGGNLERVDCSWDSAYEDLSSVAVDQVQALARVPYSNKIGTWNFPALRTLVLWITFDSPLEFGTFSGCPALETLAIHMRRSRSRRINTPTTEPSQNQPHPSTLPITSKFPRWTLTNLRKLELSDYAALLFDCASLRSMKRLNRLSLITNKSIMKVVKDTLKAKKKLDWDRAFGSGEHVDIFFMDPQSLIWHDFTLPCLHDVHLEGVAAGIIPFEWLLRCPVLETLRAVWMGPQHNLLSQPELVNWDNINYQSQLDVLELHGPWAASAEDLVWILTHHANQLSRLDLGQVVIRTGRNLQNVTVDLFKCVRQADENNQKAFESNPARWSRAPGSRLVAVNISSYSSEEKVKAMGLQIIDPSENTRKIRQRREGVRIYRLGCIYAILPEKD
ncbi:hypothetical protein BGZ68_007643 [Mortierella alpina]|nr:hypothetical protein BGZ68_007643 [Mortierella alpina]